MCLFLLGLIDNLKGATLPGVLAELNLSDAQGGTVLLLAYLGFLTAALLAGVLSDLLGNRAVVLAATFCMLLGTLGYSLARHLGLLAASMGVIGLGLGGADISGYMIMVAYVAKNKGRNMNLMAFFHGLSSTIAPYYAGLLLAAGVSWRQVYQIPLLVVAGLLAMGLLAPFPKPVVEQKSSLNLRAVGKLLLNPGLAWYFLLMILYVSSEIGFASWVVAYLQRMHGLSVTESSLNLALYFAGIMLGRLVGSVLVERAGYVRSILIAAVGATVCLLLGIFGPGKAYWVLPVTGLFFSIIFPTLTAATTDLVTENVGTLMGLLFAFCGLGGALGPWLIGVVSSQAGIQAGFAVNPVTSAGMAGGAVVLLRRKQSKL